MCLELMFLSLGLISIYYSVYLDDYMGQILAFYILAIAGSESSIGLGFLVLFFRLKGSISVTFMNLMKG